jgi:hypothetical protein
MSTRTRTLLLLGVGVGAVGLFGVGLGAGCKKQPPPPPPAPPPMKPVAAAPAAAPSPPLPAIPCPPAETFAPLKEKGRALRTDCVEFSPGRYWLAGALSYDEKTGKKPRLHLLSGGTGPRIIVFDVEPLPAADIEALIKQSKEIGVKVRKTREDRALVRMGITGRWGTPERPEQREAGILLQLAAHAPPKMLWMGPGDQTTTGNDGCISEQAIDFELLFRTRLERFTMVRARPVPGGKPAAPCGAGPSMQDSVSYQPRALAAGRPLVAEAAAPKK